MDHVLNLGYEGNGPLTELASLVEYGAFLKPKRVVWCYYEENDLDDLSAERRSLLIRYLGKDYNNNLIEYQSEIDRALGSIIERESSTIRIFKLNDVMDFLLFRRLRSLLHPWRPPVDTQLALFREVLRAAKERTESWRGHLYFVYLPQYERYDGRQFDDHPYQAVKETVEQLGIPFIDVRKAFDNHPDPLSLFPFRVKGHYNPEGYRLAAETILKELESTASSP